MMGMLGGAMSAVGSIMAGNAQAASLKAQAAFNKRQADAEYIKGSVDVGKLSREGDRVTGAQEAGYAAAGIEGQTVQDTIKSSAKEIEMDKMSIRFGRDLAASNFLYQAKINLMEAKQAKQAGFINALTGIVKLGSSFA
jgi:hypothetical protein